MFDGDSDSSWSGAEYETYLRMMHDHVPANFEAFWQETLSGLGYSVVLGHMRLAPKDVQVLFEEYSWDACRWVTLPERALPPLAIGLQPVAHAMFAY